MYYKIYGVDDEDNKKPEDFELDLNDDVYDATSPYRPIKKPVPQRNVPLPREKAKASEPVLAKFIKLVVLLVIFVFVGDYVMNNLDISSMDFSGTIEVQEYGSMSSEELEASLGLTLTKNSNMSSQIPHYTKGEVTVDGNGEIGVIYIDGKQTGIHVNSKKYTLFGVRMGYDERKVKENMMFPNDRNFFIIEDMAVGYSTAQFYCNTIKGDCLVLIYNDTSKKVVAMTYYSNYKKALERLSSI